MTSLKKAVRVDAAVLTLTEKRCIRTRRSDYRFELADIHAGDEG
jgi:hypothetical protein